MATLYDIKPAFQRLLRPLVDAGARAGITANQVTVAAMALSLAAGAVLMLVGDRALLLVPIVLLLRMALNAADGMLAREHGQRSRLGAVLNELGDVVSDAALYLPLAWLLPAPPWLMIGLVVLALIGETAGIVAVQIGATRRYDGPLGKSDRAALIGLLCLLLALGVPGGAWLTIVLAGAVVLAALTVVNRARRALAEAPPDA